MSDDYWAKAAREARAAYNTRKEADEITRLRADNAKLRAALNDVAKELDQIVHIFKGYQGMKMNAAQAALRAAAAALEGVTEPASPWRDIKSAPKDGTMIVGCSTHKDESGNLRFNWIADGYFDECGFWYFSYSDEDFEPTHWMPLPEPPR